MTTGIDVLDAFAKLDNEEKERFADLSAQPLALGLYALDVMEGIEKGGYHNIYGITAALERAGVAVDPDKLRKAFARAGDRVAARDTGGMITEYRIMIPGRRYLESFVSQSAIAMAYVQDGKPMTGRMELKQLLSSLAGKVKVADPYYGIRTLESLASLPKKSSVQFLTSKTSESAVRLSGPLLDFKREFPNVQLRIFSEKALHDRYIITPDKFLLLGQGIKDIGEKESFLLQLPRRFFPDTVETLSRKFDERWGKAVPL